MSSLTSHELEFGRSAEKMSIYLAYGCPKHSLNLLSKDTREHEHHVGNTSVCHIPQLLCIIFFWLVQLDGELLKTETMVITSLECFLASIIALRMSFLFTMFTYWRKKKRIGRRFSRAECIFFLHIPWKNVERQCTLLYIFNLISAGFHDNLWDNKWQCNFWHIVNTDILK